MTKSIAAIRTALASFAQTVSVGAIYFFLTPIIIKWFGKDMYGLWIFLIQFVAYVTWLDIMPGSSLKLQIASQHMKLDDDQKMRQIGAIITLSIKSGVYYIIGFFIMLGILYYLVDTNVISFVALGFILFILTLNTYLLKFVSVPRMVLRGLNRDYETFIIMTIFLVIFAFIDLLVVLSNGKIIALVVVKLIDTIILGIFFWFYVKRSVSWFGFKKPASNDIVVAKNHNIWLYGINVTSILTNQFELVLVGFLFTTSQMAIYAITSSLMAKLFQIYMQIANAINPSLGNIYGESGEDSLSFVRGVSIKLNLIVGLALFFATLLVNKSFTYAWVGSSLYGGESLSVALLSMWFVRIILDNSQRYYMVMLQIKEAVFMQFLGGIVFLSLLCVLYYYNNQRMVYVPISMAIGSLVIITALELKSKIRSHFTRIDALRIFLVIFLSVFGIACIYLGNLYFISSKMIHILAFFIFAFFCFSFLLSILVINRSEFTFLSRLLIKQFKSVL